MNRMLWTARAKSKNSRRLIVWPCPTVLRVRNIRRPP